MKYLAVGNNYINRSIHDDENHEKWKFTAVGQLMLFDHYMELEHSHRRMKLDLWSDEIGIMYTLVKNINNIDNEIENHIAFCKKEKRCLVLDRFGDQDVDENEQIQIITTKYIKKTEEEELPLAFITEECNIYFNDTLKTMLKNEPINPKNFSLSHLPILDQTDYIRIKNIEKQINNGTIDISNLTEEELKDKYNEWTHPALRKNRKKKK